MSFTTDALTAVRHSDRVLCEQVSTWEPLDFGIAHCSASLALDTLDMESMSRVDTRRDPVATGREASVACQGLARLPAANQLRDAWLADTDPQTAYRRAEEYYTVRGLSCLAWVPASGQPLEPIENLLLAKSWHRVDRTAFQLDPHSPAIDALLAESNPDIRILPARSMPKALRASFSDESPALETRRDSVAPKRGACVASQGPDADCLLAATRERLNDARYTLSLALVDGQPAGRAAYLEAGEIARLTDLFILPAFRRRGIARALIAHFLQTARRLLPKSIVAAAPAADDPAQSILRRAGFTPSGTLTEFHRPI